MEGYKERRSKTRLIENSIDLGQKILKDKNVEYDKILYCESEWIVDEPTFIWINVHYRHQKWGKCTFCTDPSDYAKYIS